MTPLSAALATLTLISLALCLWQWVVARRFPLHQRPTSPAPAPAVTLLKPVHGADPETARCLASWLVQQHPAPVQILFGVADPNDPAVPMIRELLQRHPGADAQLLLCTERLGTNPKVSTLAQLHRQARHPTLVLSDADVHVPPDFLTTAVQALQATGSGLVSCLYRLSAPRTLAMEWETIAVNADFWSQVLQARCLGPLDFALGATIVTTRDCLAAAGGFEALAHHLADDFLLGHRAARGGFRLDLCPVPVECHEPLTGWRRAWNRQVRWARTVRFCKPLPFFCSIANNATLWSLLLLLLGNDSLPPALASAPHPATASLSSPSLLPSPPHAIPWTFPLFLATLLVRIGTALANRARMEQSPVRLSRWWMIPVKDLLHAAVWLLAFSGNRIEWRHQLYRIRPSGRLEPVG